MKTSAPSKENCLLQTKNLGLVFGAEPSLLRKGLCRRHLGVRRPDAAFATTSALFQGGVKPPHSKALRALSWSPGPRQPAGMRACHQIVFSDCSGPVHSALPCRARFQALALDNCHRLAKPGSRVKGKVRRGNVRPGERGTRAGSDHAPRELAGGDAHRQTICGSAACYAGWLRLPDA